MANNFKFTRSRNVFQPNSLEPFKISRSKLENYLKCQRCFYLDRRLGLSQPPTIPFNLNIAVDLLLKKEFDEYRLRGVPHPLMVQSGFKGVPFRHEKLEYWRDALRGGIAHHHKESGFILTGGIDDLWINQQEEICIVDYKATAKEMKPNITGEWQASYRRQADIYVWLFKQNQFKVSKTAYFVYCNGNLFRPRFEGHLDFDIEVLSYDTDDSWVSPALVKAAALLRQNEVPDFRPDCDFCKYNQGMLEVTGQQQFKLD